MSWMADPALVSQCLVTLISFDPQEGDLMELLEAIGTLQMLGRTQLLEEVVNDNHRKAFQEGIAQTLAQYYPGLVEWSQSLFLEHILDLDAEDSDTRAYAWMRVQECLKHREQLELCLTGAQFLSPGWEWPAQVALSIAEFDGAIMANLWKLLPFKEERETGYAWANPKMRPRLWWWWLSNDLPADILDQMANVAILLARWPEAQSYLDSLVQAAKAVRL